LLYGSKKINEGGMAFANFDFPFGDWVCNCVCVTLCMSLGVWIGIEIWFVIIGYRII